MTDKEQIICTEEICPYCDNTVELPPFKGIYECPECKELIVCCSMCEEQSCNECKYTLLTQSKEQLSSKTQECEELEEKNKILRQMYESMAELCEIKDEAIIDKQADIEELKEQLETAEEWRIKAEGLNEKFELKNTHYRKALEEIAKIVTQDRNIKDVCLIPTCLETSRVAYDIQQQIIDIINKAKGEE